MIRTLSESKQEFSSSITSSYTLPVFFVTCFTCCSCVLFVSPLSSFSRICRCRRSTDIHGNHRTVCSKVSVLGCWGYVQESAVARIYREGVGHVLDNWRDCDHEIFDPSLFKSVQMNVRNFQAVVSSMFFFPSHLVWDLVEAGESMLNFETCFTETNVSSRNHSYHFSLSLRIWKSDYSSFVQFVLDIGTPEVILIIVMTLCRSNYVCQCKFENRVELVMELYKDNSCHVTLMHSETGQVLEKSGTLLTKEYESQIRQSFRAVDESRHDKWSPRREVNSRSRSGLRLTANYTQKDDDATDCKACSTDIRCHSKSCRKSSDGIFSKEKLRK